MPTAPPSRCLITGCSEWAVTRGRCAGCYVPWEQRSKRNTTMTDRKAERLWRRGVMRRDPMCRACGVAPSTDADHVIPVGDGGAPYDVANGQGLCHDCHDIKTRRENAERNRERARIRHALP